MGGLFGIKMETVWFGCFLEGVSDVLAVDLKGGT